MSVEELLQRPFEYYQTIVDTVHHDHLVPWVSGDFYYHKSIANSLYSD